MRPKRKAFMAEFKFSCPLCQQHILCDTDYSGNRINCPSCQKEIVVPQAPPVAAVPPAPVAPSAASGMLLPPPPPPPVSAPSPVTPPTTMAAAAGLPIAGAPRVVDEPPPKFKFTLARCGLVAVLIIGLAAGGYCYWWMSRPQVITLRGGDKLTLIGVTVGRHHVAPKIKIGGRFVRGNVSLPQSTNDTLVVWVEAEHKPNQYPNYQLMIYDRENTACVGTYTSTQSQINNKVNILGYMFNAYPRWDRSMIVRVVSNGNGGRSAAKQQFVISNPKRVSVPKWAPEPLPDKQTDGDLAVTLTKLEYGAHQAFGGQFPGRNDPANKSVLAVFHAEQNGVGATNWEAVRIETSDATGNRAQNNSWSTSRDQNGDATMTYQWGLWPDQPWKVNVEMSRTAGFSNDEMWSVTNLPVMPGSQSDLWNYGNGTRRTPPAFAETTLQGIHLKIYQAIQFTNVNYGNGQKPGGFRVQADKPLDGLQVTLASATDEGGRPIPFYGGGGGGGDSRQIQFQNLRNAKLVNITLALHKNRFFQFTVKPSSQAAGNNN
jgi:hypothetical protein